MKISECGQVTIPPEFRDRYGLLPNTEAQFVPEANGLRLVAGSTAKAAAIHAVYGRKTFERGTDELMALLRG
mgnify:CR=1 FL=1